MFILDCNNMQYFFFVLGMIFIVGILLLIKGKDKKTGIKGTGISSFLTIITKLFLVGFPLFIWFGEYDTTPIYQIALLGIPFAVIFVVQSDGFKDGVISYFQGLIIGAFLLFVIQTVRIIGLDNENIILIEKILSTIMTILAWKVTYQCKYEGWIKKEVGLSTTKLNLSNNSKKSYSFNRESYSNYYNTSSGYSGGYTTYPSTKNNGTCDIFAVDTRVEYNSFTGKNEYYQNGKLIAKGEKSPFSGNETIYDINGNKILTKEQGIFSDYVYKDTNGNTKYKEDYDYLFGVSNVYDNNYNKVAEHDFLDDIFGTDKHYTSKKY